MIYNNILYLLIVILILSSRPLQQPPQLPWAAALAVFTLKALLHYGGLRYAAHKNFINSSRTYFSAEQKFSIVAVISLAIDVYLLDLSFYLAQLPLADQLPTIAHFLGVALFFFYLALFWNTAQPSYRRIFQNSISKPAFISANLKNSFAILLPWLLLSLFSDLLQLLDIPALNSYLASPWGEPTIFLLFIVMLLLIFPLLVTRLWNCTPLPAGPTRSHLEEFCRQHHLDYADILLWPLFGARLLTAGVMGFIKKSRFLLITPAMLETMTITEIEAVIAHEIGHVKRYHLQLYLLLFLGFGLVLQLSAGPMLNLAVGSGFFLHLTALGGDRPFALLTLVSTFLVLTVMIVYFRYLFGFFMRNFERQADIYAMQSSGGSGPLVRVFEKIGILSGNIRDLPSWHHFSIAQRVGFLLRCERDPGLIARHHRKVYLAIFFYLAVLALGGVALWKMPNIFSDEELRANFAITYLQMKIAEEPDTSQWHHFLADVQFSKKMFTEARDSYNRALELAPDSADTMNNLAWLLLTAAEANLHDPQRALDLARKAVLLKPQGYILDTLAEAYYQNGRRDLAIETIKRALAADPSSDYFRSQLDKFSGQRQAAPPAPPANPGP